MNKLFGDMKTDEEKSAFFLSGRGYETGVIAQAIQNDVAMAYHRCAEYKKELEALQSKDKEDAERYRRLRKGDIDDVAVVQGLGAMDYGASAVIATYSVEIDGDDLDSAIDHARRIEGE